MPITVIHEKGISGQLNESTDEDWVFFVAGASNSSEATLAVYNWLLATLGNPPQILVGARTLVLKNFSYDEEIDRGWRVNVEWGSFQRKEPLSSVPGNSGAIIQPGQQSVDSAFSFEIGIQPIRIVLPIGTQEVYKRSDDEQPTPKITLIGDQGIPDQEPAGAEVYEPVHTESETHIFHSAAITNSFKTQIKRCIGRTNQQAFKGHDAGECLLQAVSGQQRGASDWELSFRWGVRENIDNETIAGISGISRTGWQYLWPRYVIARDENDAPVLTRQIRYIVVATVFREADYSQLGIGQ